MRLTTEPSALACDAHRPDDMRCGRTPGACPLKGATGAYGDAARNEARYCKTRGRSGDGSNGAVARDHRCRGDAGLAGGLGINAYRVAVAGSGVGVRAWRRTQPEGKGEVGSDGEVAVLQRRRYIQRHVPAAREPLRDHLAGPLHDHADWADGCGRRVGLICASFESQRRVPKASGNWYRNSLRAEQHDT
jgi:beta-glucosidase/6-phospho-beta-glucosidase/beta-galactosidase